MSTSYTDRDRTLALAGIFQAGALVQQVARKGTCDSQAMENSIRSLLNLNPESVEAIYAGPSGVKMGLTLLHSQLMGPSQDRDIEITKYVISLLYLERKLTKQAEMLNKMQQGLLRAQSQAEHFSFTHSNVLASIADLYTNTLSTLKPRITVSGEHIYLTNPDNANQIRALLLSGIRSAVLWTQCGGTRLTLLFGRKRLVREATAMLDSIR